MSFPAASAILDYRQLQFVLAADLDRLHLLAGQLQLPAVAAQIKQNRERLADPRFTVAVVGEFKRGKSTFINALLGREILPSDIQPTSAAISRITYGTDPDARLLHRDGTESRIPLEQLSQFVTGWTETSTANAAGIKEAIVYCPATLCRDEVDIVDTPGLCDDNVSITRLTRDFLPCADAVIFVILATSPFSKSEWDFLDSLLVDFGLSSVFFLVNALDRLHSDPDRERAVSLVRSRIAQKVSEHAAKQFGEHTAECDSYLQSAGKPRVFGVSGRLALEAKLTQHDLQLRDTGLPQFEAFFLQFLADNRVIVGLKTHLDRAVRVCDEICKQPAPEEESAHEQRSVANGYEALLKSVEWMIEDAKSCLRARQIDFELHAQKWLDHLHEAYSQTAIKYLNTLTLSGDDLEDAVFPTFLNRLGRDVSVELNKGAEQAAESFASSLSQHLASAVSDILRFAVAFDRIMLHGTSLPGLSFPHNSLCNQMGNSPDAALDWLLKPHMTALTRAAREWLSADPEWTTGLHVSRIPSTGPKFMKKAVDFVRAAAVKGEILQAVPLAIRNHLANSAAMRMELVSKQAVQVSYVMTVPLDLALQQTRSRLSTLRSVAEGAEATKAAAADLLKRQQEETQQIRARSVEASRHLSRILTST